MGHVRLKGMTTLKSRERNLIKVGLLGFGPLQPNRTMAVFLKPYRELRFAHGGGEIAGEVVSVYFLSTFGEKEGLAIRKGRVQGTQKPDLQGLDQGQESGDEESSLGWEKAANAFSSSFHILGFRGTRIDHQGVYTLCW